MTLEAMQWHEAATLPFIDEDYRRTGLARLARRYVVGRRVLDMRCLTGSLAVALAAEGRDVVALDGCEQAVEMTNARARQQGLNEEIAHRWDLTDLVGWVNGVPFDTVLCLDVLNHVRDDEATVADIASVLCPGGRLILTAPAFPALLGKRDQSLGHLRRYAKAGLRNLLERHGLRVQMMRYWNFTALPAYALIERGLRRRVSDRLRYGSDGTLGLLRNRVLSSWYTTVENWMGLPFGLTLFALAYKPQGSR